MLKTIVFREIQEQIKSMKLHIGFAATIVLIVFITFVNINDYSVRQQAYHDAIQYQKENPDGYISVFRQPQPLSIIALGKDRFLGNRADLYMYQKPVQTTNYLSESGQPTDNTKRIISIDYAYVVKTILSLLIIFLSYNAISGEQVQGTLKQVIANSIPRHIVLLGKLIGGLTVVLAALFVATLIAFLIMLLHPLVSLGIQDIIRIFLMFVVSSIYLSFFYLCGLGISVLSKRPSLALTYLVQIWIILIFIIPNLSIFIADTSYTLPDLAERYHQKDIIGRQMQAEGLNDMRGKNLVEVTNMTADFNYTHDLEYDADLSRQAKRAQRLSMISPAVLYDQLMIRYARTGIDEYERFISNISFYWENTFRYDPDEDVDSYLDLSRSSSLPTFTYRSEPISSSILGTLYSFFALVVLNLLLFFVTHIQFINKDVR